MRRYEQARGTSDKVRYNVARRYGRGDKKSIKRGASGIVITTTTSISNFEVSYRLLTHALDTDPHLRCPPACEIDFKNFS